MFLVALNVLRGGIQKWSMVMVFQKKCISPFRSSFQKSFGLFWLTSTSFDLIRAIHAVIPSVAHLVQANAGGASLALELRDPAVGDHVDEKPERDVGHVGRGEKGPHCPKDQEAEKKKKKRRRSWQFYFWRRFGRKKNLFFPLDPKKAPN